MTAAEIYLDYAATAPVDPAVSAAMSECLAGEFANPSSTHAAGARAKELVETARAAIAARVGASSRDIVFTSGATEANNLALKGVLLRSRGRRVHLVTSRIEHRSVLDVAQRLEGSRVTTTYVDATAAGFVDPTQVIDAITADTQLVSVMHVNNETGVIQDVTAIGEACRRRGVLFHVDAAQSVGKLPLALAEAPIDLCSLTAHKLCGPKGIGALYIAPRVTLASQIQGGEQERSLRAGTLPTHQIVGMGKAYALADPAREAPRLAGLRDRLWQGLSAIPGVHQNGAEARRAAHLLNVTLPGVDGESLRFELRDLAVSAGSACAADSPEASHVLTGMGLSDVRAASSLRFSVGRFTSEDEIERAAARVAAAVDRLRSLAKSAPAWCSA